MGSDTSGELERRHMKDFGKMEFSGFGVQAILAAVKLIKLHRFSSAIE